MDSNVAKITTVPDPSPVLGVADAALGRQIASRVERFAPAGRVLLASSLPDLRRATARGAPRVIALDSDLLGHAPLADALAALVAVAPVVLLAPLERQPEIAPLLVSGDVEFVARCGEFVPVLSAVIERRLRWAGISASLLEARPLDFPEDLGAVFRHEINNPLTGILGNAELLLAHRERLTPVDTQRLQIVVDLSVRLRETIRRLSNAWEQRPASAKSA